MHKSLHSVCFAPVSFSEFNFLLWSTTKLIFHVFSVRVFIVFHSRTPLLQICAMLSRLSCLIFCFLFFISIFYLRLPFCGVSSRVWHRAYSFKWLNCWKWAEPSRVELSWVKRSILCCVCVCWTKWYHINKFRSSLCVFAAYSQRLRHSTFPKSWTSALEFIPEHILRRGDIFNGWLWRFRARHMAVAALHGYHDMCCTHCIAHTGKLAI